MPRYIVKSYLDCKRCPLHQFRRSIVYGRGTLPAKVLFIGEAPGKSEDLLGEPFIGPSGRLLNAAMEMASKLGQCEIPSFFISNIVACRPTDEANGPNREPTQDEAWRCRERLMVTYADANPRRVLFLGKVPERYGRKLFPDAVALPHPAYILRLGGQNCPLFTTFARDLSQVFKEVNDGN